MPSKEKKEKGKPKVKPPLQSDFTKQFEKDWTRLERSGRYDMALLKTVMLLIIANDGMLPAEYKDHPLTGDWDDHRECHVRGDFLLIYQVEDDTAIFTRTGSHADLFE